MIVNCLKSQENLFEIRVLKRFSDINFIPNENILKEQEYPLILFTNWDKNDFDNNLNYFLSLAYKLEYPMILFPNFKEKDLQKILDLNSSFEIKSIDTNKIKVLDSRIIESLAKDTLKIQADYYFESSSGKTLVNALESNKSVVISIQNKNTSTPLIICGVRLLSSSGLSDDQDRKILFENLVNWSIENKLDFKSDIKKEEIIKDDYYFINNTILKNICLIIFVLNSTNIQKIIELITSIFGINTSESEVLEILDFLDSKNLITNSNELVICNIDLMEKLIKDLNLWSYVRLLKENINSF